MLVTKYRFVEVVAAPREPRLCFASTSGRFWLARPVCSITREATGNPCFQSQSHSRLADSSDLPTQPIGVLKLLYQVITCAASELKTSLTLAGSKSLPVISDHSSASGACYVGACRSHEDLVSMCSFARHEKVQCRYNVPQSIPLDGQPNFRPPKRLVSRSLAAQFGARGETNGSRKRHVLRCGHRVSLLKLSMNSWAARDSSLQTANEESGLVKGHLAALPSNDGSRCSLGVRKCFARSNHSRIVALPPLFLTSIFV